MELNIFNFDFKEQKEFWFFLCGDLHIDDPKHDRVRLISELKEAKQKKARIFINGDAISGIFKGDKRFTQSADKYSRDDAINMMIDETTEVLIPYVNLIDVIGIGNHETALIKHHSTDIVREVVKDLNRIRDKKLAPIVHGGYCGFIVLRFCYSNRKYSYTIYRHHGKGTNAPVTKGMIDFSRIWMYDADLIWLAHKHTRFQTELGRIIYPNIKDSISERLRMGVVTGAYLKNVNQYDIKKEGYQMNYGEEGLFGTQALGGWFLRLKYRHNIMVNKKLGLESQCISPSEIISNVVPYNNDDKKE